jgi:hypothetical protein
MLLSEDRLKEKIIRFGKNTTYFVKIDYLLEENQSSRSYC